MQKNKTNLQYLNTENPYPEAGKGIWRKGNSILFFPSDGYFPCRCIKTNSEDDVVELFESLVYERYLKTFLLLFIPRAFLFWMKGSETEIIQIYVNRKDYKKRVFSKVVSSLCFLVGILFMIAGILTSSLVCWIVFCLLFSVFVVIRQMAPLLKLKSWNDDFVELSGAGLRFVESLEHYESNQSL